MGEFVLREIDRASGRTLAQQRVRNFLANEAIEYVYRQIFPTYQDPMTFVMGVSGPNTAGPEGRPQSSGGGTPLNRKITFAQVTGTYANEGGCYTDAMRTSFGYSRQAVAFIADEPACKGRFVSPELVFTNAHEWSPQNRSAWDDPDTTDVIEQAPPEWAGRYQPDPPVGFPWHYPRKLCSDVGTGDDRHLAYMKTWDPTGGLDWLCDFRKIGGWPVTCAWIADSSRAKLVALGVFSAPVLLWPETLLHLSYDARFYSVDGRTTAAFLARWAKYAFEKAGSRYSAFYVRPVIEGAPPPGRDRTYAEYVPYFLSAFPAVSVASWTYVAYSAGPPEVWPHMKSGALEWLNNSGNPQGPVAALVVYGVVGSENELLWVTPFTPVTIPNGDSLRVPDGVKFWLDSV